MKYKTKVIGMVLGVTLFVILVSGITYAVFGWVSDPNTGYIGGTSECFNISYTKGTDILDGTLKFGSSYLDGIYTTVSAGLDTNCNIEQGIGTLYLITSTETSDSVLGLIRYQVLEDGTPVDGGSGVITEPGNKAIYTNFNITSDVKEYTVYVWVNISDITDDNLSNIMASSYSGSISMTAESR